MDTIRTNKDIIREFCAKNMDTHTDWTGTRVETKSMCESVLDFVDNLFEYLEDNQYKC